MTVASLWPLHGIGMKDFKGGMGHGLENGTFERGMGAWGESGGGETVPEGHLSYRGLCVASVGILLLLHKGPVTREYRKFFILVTRTVETFTRA